MKKVLCAAAVLAICATPLAAMAEGTTVYGQLRYSVNSVDEDTVSGQDGLSGEDNVSLFGLNGSFGEDVKAFFHIQTGANADAAGDAFSQRFFFGGLEGAFGKVAYGRMTNAYKYPGFALDPFYNYSGVNAAGAFSAGGATYGLSGATNGFTENAVQYVTPSMAGVKVTGGVFIDDSNEDDHGYLIGASYAYKALNVGAVFATNDDTATIAGLVADGDAIRGYANYKFNDTWKAALSVEQVDIDDPTAVDPTDTMSAEYVYLTGTMMVPSIKMDFSAAVGVVTDGPAEGTGITLGAWYDVAKNTKLFALASYADIDPDETDYPGADHKPLVISLGAQHKFSLSSN
ncbi:MAG: porin [Deltaproteobacteria bacterium]|jgi:hypothetical protein|nr:porin [Deltaproteobacteria bacterium]